MEDNPIDYELFRSLLSSTQPAAALPANLHDALLQAGAIQLLIEDGGDSAVNLLEEAVRSCPIPRTAAFALDGLLRLSQQAKHPALVSLYRLALEDGLPAAVNAIQSAGLESPLVWQNRSYRFLFQPHGDYQTEDPHLEQLLRVFLTEASSPLQERIQQRAQKLGFVQWSQIASALRSPGEATLDRLSTEYHGYTQFEKRLARDWLEQFALAGSTPAQNALCELFILWDDQAAANVAANHGWLPNHAERKALFLFLTGQWEPYEIIDFSYRYLISAYESGSPGLRQRLLSHSRLSGHNEWLQSLGEVRRRRWLSDLTDVDWRAAVKQLTGRQAWDEAWRLLIHAPPLWSAELILMLFQSSWKAATESDRLSFLNLVSLAQQALKRPPEVFARNILKAPSPNLAATAMRADGQVIAAGGQENRIYLWNCPSGERRNDFISSPAPGVRALALSPDGLYLAAAFTDQAIRIFRLEDARLVKTLEGHSALIRSLMIHPDGRTLFSASFDGTLRTWRFPLGPESGRIAPEMGELFAAAASPEGDRFVVAGSQVEVWRWPSNDRVHTLSIDGVTVLHLSRAKNKPLVAGTGQNQALYLWNDASGRLLEKIDKLDAPISAIALSPDGDFLLGGTRQGAIHLWNAFTGEKLAEMQGHENPIVGLHWHFDGGFVSASQDGRLIIWDARLIRWIRQPLDRLAEPEITEIHTLSRDKSLSTQSQAWIAFLLELVQFKQRFDILLDEADKIQLTEFDIEL